VRGELERLLPDPGPTSVAEQLEDLVPSELARDERPYVVTNFAVTLDGRATIGGRSGAIGSETDTAMLVGLRAAVDAVMIGAGTLRAERYGRMIANPQIRARRERRGLAHDPLAVIVSARMDLPWDAGLFSEGGRVLVVSSSAVDPPPTEVSLRVDRHEGGVDLGTALRRLRQERGIRLLLCEGGPRLHAALHAAGLVDEMFVTVAPKLAGGEGPRMIEGALGVPVGLELAWLLAAGSELFARYRVRRGD
jgi:riboflavin-specific deaminase-like protein